MNSSRLLLEHIVEICRKDPQLELLGHYAKAYESLLNLSPKAIIASHVTAGNQWISALLLEDKFPLSAETCASLASSSMANAHKIAAMAAENGCPITLCNQCGYYKSPNGKCPQIVIPEERYVDTNAPTKGVKS